MEITENTVFSMEKYQKNLHVHHYFCLSPTLPDIWTADNRQSFSLSFAKVPKIIKCPRQFLPVPDRWTASNFHPCLIMEAENNALLKQPHTCLISPQVSTRRITKRNCMLSLDLTPSMNPHQRRKTLMHQSGPQCITRGGMGLSENSTRILLRERTRLEWMIPM